MPGFLTHWHILIETARRTEDAGSNLSSLIGDASALRRRAHGWIAPPPTTPAGAVWNTGPLPAIDYHFPGSDISSMAYLGALAPDIPSYEQPYFSRRVRDDGVGNAAKRQATSDSVDWSALLHTHRSGDILVALLEHIAAVPAPALRSQTLAFAMGYVTHLAADMALQPYIHALACLYEKRELPGIIQPLGRRFYVELCLDHIVAETYFNHSLYDRLRRPWRAYIEPASTRLLQPGSLSANVSVLFTDALENIYGLSEARAQQFAGAFRDGLRRLQRVLSGNGASRWLAWRWLMTESRRENDPIITTLSTVEREAGTIRLEQAIAYTIRLSEHLCRLAIGYYSLLRNAEATASERDAARRALRGDICNWDTSTGYRVDITFDEQATLRLLHNWVHFARLWETEEAYREGQSLSHLA